MPHEPALQRFDCFVRATLLRELQKGEEKSPVY